VISAREQPLRASVETHRTEHEMTHDDARSALLRECIRIHFDLARASLRRSMIIVLFIALAGAVAMGVAGVSVVFFLLGLVVVPVLALPIPAAVWYVNVSRVRKLRSEIEKTPDALVGVVLGGGAPVRSAAGGAAVGAIYAGKQHVSIRTTTSSVGYVLWLPPQKAAELAGAFAAR
jgi:hypothetical protein